MSRDSSGSDQSPRVTESAMDSLLEQIESVVASPRLEDFVAFLSDDTRFNALLKEDARFAGILEVYKRHAQERSPISSQHCSPREHSESDMLGTSPSAGVVVVVGNVL